MELTRREALLTGLAALLTTPAAVPPKKPPANRRLFQRFDFGKDQWFPIHPTAIQPNDVIWMRDDPPTAGLPGNGHVVRINRVNHAKQELYSDIRIDQATNQWIYEDGLPERD